MRKIQPGEPRSEEKSLIQRLRSFSFAKLNPDRVDASRFEGLHPIGKGCMGTVFKAIDRESGNPVAIKVADARYSAQAAMDNEIKSLCRVQHLNIVRYIGQGRLYGEGFDGERFMVTEYLDGLALSQAVKGGKTLPWEIAKPVILDMCLALGAVHHARMVHRDIKPSNIFLSTNKTKLIDFGVSEKTGAMFHLAQSFTPGNGNYAAPELFSGATDIRSDIYSLGMVMYRIISGRLPENPLFCMEKKDVDVDGLDSALASVVLRATEKAVERRYQSAKEMWAAVACR